MQFHSQMGCRAWPGGAAAGPDPAGAVGWKTCLVATGACQEDGLALPGACVGTIFPYGQSRPRSDCGPLWPIHVPHFLVLGSPLTPQCYGFRCCFPTGAHPWVRGHPQLPPHSQGTSAEPRDLHDQHFGGRATVSVIKHVLCAPAFRYPNPAFPHMSGIVFAVI